MNRLNRCLLERNYASVRKELALQSVRMSWQKANLRMDGWCYDVMLTVNISWIAREQHIPSAIEWHTIQICHNNNMLVHVAASVTQIHWIMSKEIPQPTTNNSYCSMNFWWIMKEKKEECLNKSQFPLPPSSAHPALNWRHPHSI